LVILICASRRVIQSAERVSVLAIIVIPILVHAQRLVTGHAESGNINVINRII